MNFREGMRRVGLAAGLVGSVAGAVMWLISYDEISAEREKVRTFRVLTQLPEVRRAIEAAHKAQLRHSTIDMTRANVLVDNHGISIKVIQLDNDGEIEWIEKSDGNTIYKPWEDPSIWRYMLLPFWPLGGFIAPWALLKALTWIVSGFMKSP